MDNPTLSLDDLNVETFETSTTALAADALKCTGCPSGCGIFGEP